MRGCAAIGYGRSVFCPSCGAPNPDDAKFCNQCGWRLAAPTQQGDGAPQKSPTQQGVAGEPSSSASQQGGATLSGLSTHDMAAAMVTGPSKRSLVFAGVGIGLAGIALGALVAFRSSRPPEETPVTPVGLIGEPSSVQAPQTEENDAGTIVPVAPAPAPTGGRSGRTARPANVASAAPTPTPAAPRANPTTPPAAPRTNPAAAPQPGDERLPSGNILRRDAAGNTTVLGADGQPLVQLSRGGATPAPTPTPTPANPAVNPATNTPPPAENGVVERGPRTSAGGYRPGDETDATGTMDPQAFQFVYRHYQSQIAACWSSASRAHEVSGVMVVRVRVGEADGHVVRTRIISDSTHDAGLQACVQNAIRGWRYPRPDGGDVEVDYPLRFGTTTR